MSANSFRFKPTLEQSYQIMDAFLQHVDDLESFNFQFKLDDVLKIDSNFPHDDKTVYFKTDIPPKLKGLADDYGLIKDARPNGKYVQLTASGRKAKEMNNFKEFVDQLNNPPMTEFEGKTLKLAEAANDKSDTANDIAHKAQKWSYAAVIIAGLVLLYEILSAL